MKRWPYESLVHALVLGPLVFVGYWLVADHGAASERIVIDGGQVASIRAQFRRTWSRNPTDDELRALVGSVVRAEILYREAVKLGLEPDDPALEQRVRMKYEVQADKRLAARAPTNAELIDWLALHAADYARPATVTFSQLLLVAAGTSGDAADVARRVRLKLDRGVKRTKLGLPTALPAQEFHVRLDEVERGYGRGFADVIARLPVGIWLGPVESRYGAHLVRVESLVPGTLPPLDEVRQEVLRGFAMKRRQRALEAELMAMRWNYEVVVEPALTRQAAQ